MLKADGFDDAVLGVATQHTKPPLIVYDYWKCCEVLIKRDGMTMSDAVEYMDYNVVCAWLGPGTPMFLQQQSMKEIEAEIKEQGEII